MIDEKTPKHLGQILIDEGVITKDQLNIALTEQKRVNEPLGKLLISLGFATEAIMRSSLGEALKQDSVDLSRVVPDCDAIKMITSDTARKHKVVPLNFDPVRSTLTIAMSDTFNLFSLDRIRIQVGEHIELLPKLSGEAEISNAIDQFYGHELSIDGILREIETGEVDYTNYQGDIEEYSQPLVRLVGVMLSDAVKRGSSDIHFEPEESFLRIRYRIDGVLRQIRSLHKTYWPAIAVRLKVMADMNIAETRAPQDGRISRTIIGRPIDFRVASQPTIHGENIVLRVLDRERGVIPLEKLELPKESLRTLKIMMSRPEGIILVTGPTGSGKTTTLYSLLNYISSEQINIMTLEDPVEYPFPLIRQTSVNEAAGMGFANGIKSLMRQDPDVILVGEVRDAETAEMAFRAAMTGHQVFTTLHTNSAIGALPRLRDIGIIPEIIAGNIIGVIAQRLVRKLCPFCKTAHRPAAENLQLLSNREGLVANKIFKPKGCTSCDNTGYKGRLALLEILKMNSDLDDLLARGATTKEIREAAYKRGFFTLADDGVRHILEGITSIEEVARVIDLTERMS
ncbi:MAG: type II secretory ATPase GspE/PulE/Tfp pilus assembly ATPase PilB-like protein [Gammaproteobacteria bacterium]|jgi:type II secretory ATPase GspE/PulE/Tfp pilus assembly ATPase PilB-like protein